jgi:hypothetical protein
LNNFPLSCQILFNVVALGRFAGYNFGYSKGIPRDLCR